MMSQIKTSKFLEDPSNKISQTFEVPDSIKTRVNFWFEIYTAFTTKQHVIHHSAYPWLVYDIVDTSHIFKKYKNKFKAKKEAKKLVRKHKNDIRKILNKLARLKKFTKLNKKEFAILKQIQTIDKNFKKQLWIARKKVRSQNGLKDHFTVGLENSHLYEPFLNEIFKRKGIPQEITALPLLESNFDVEARSKVGASGIWQIMKPTGRQYGIVNRNFDERNSPYKATLIAAKLLNFNYGQFKNWPLAITAYNNGAGNLRRAMRRAKTKDPFVLINNHKRGAFGFASSNFYASFLAALYVKSYADDIFKIKQPKPLVLEKIKIKRSTSFRYIVHKTGLSLKKIKEINLDLRRRVKLSTIVPRNFTLYLPKGSSKKLLDKNIYLVDYTGKKIKKGT